MFQIFLVGFSLYVIQRVFRQYRAHKVRFSWFLLWSIFSVVVIVVAFNPGVTDRLASVVGIGRGADLVVYTSLAILFGAMLSHMVRLRRLDAELTELVRKIALEKGEKDV